MTTTSIEATSDNQVVIEYLDSNKWCCDLAPINGFSEVFPGCSEDQAEVQFTYTLNGEESPNHNYTCYSHVNDKLAQILENEMQNVPHVLVLDDVDAEDRRANFQAVGGDLWARMTIIEKPAEA